ncbi:hypothetical protein [Comamonas testosteroni]|uniref:hypothetical protein n=1 Tax=Comamonas testosteroni TaxID=285 RepID=UPI0012D36FD7|nr:hypothetical protein [Comamonas testosteroni]
MPIPSQSQQRQAALEARVDAMNASTMEIQEGNVHSALANAQKAALWISTNRPDVAMGLVPEIKLVAEDDVFTLPELEDYGRAGNAIKLCNLEFGDLWWCDPEGRPTASHKCLLYPPKASLAASARTALLRFYRPEEIETKQR